MSSNILGYLRKSNTRLCLQNWHLTVIRDFPNIFRWVYSLWNSNALCLTAPSHFLNQCLFFTSGVGWHSIDTNFAPDAEDIKLSNEFRIMLPTITYTPPKANVWSVYHNLVCNYYNLPDVSFTISTTKRHEVSSIPVTLTTFCLFLKPQFAIRPRK